MLVHRSRTARLLLAAVVATSVGYPALAGRDIVRIISPEPGFNPNQGTQTPQPNNNQVPKKGPNQPPGNRTNVNAGKFVKVPLRLGAMTSDSSRPWLGVNLDNEPIERAFAISVGLMNPQGAIITETTPGGPASVAGLRAGDIAVNIAGNAIANSDQLRQVLARNTPGTEVIVEVWRFVPEGSDYVSTLRRMGDEGNATIMAMLGHMYAAAKGVPRNDTEAAGWFQRAATAGHPASMVEYAHFLQEGRGIGKNDQEALRWFRAAADTGNNYGIWRYALVVLDGKITAKDTSLAAQLFQRAADAGFAPAMYDLGVMHANAIGMARNYQMAARLYQKAVDLNNSSAMVNLGLLYDEGKGVDQNETKAVELYRRAVGLGHVSGMQNLAVMLDGGRGVPQRDPDQAADLILRAVSLKNDFSYKQLLNNHAAYTQEFRMAVQRRLQSANLYTGAIDGDFGQSTQAAITGYFNRR